MYSCSMTSPVGNRIHKGCRYAFMKIKAAHEQTHRVVSGAVISSEVIHL